MAFNARLDVNYSYTTGPLNEIFLNTVYIENTNIYYVDNIQPGFRILQDVTGFGFSNDILIFDISEVLGSSDGGLTYDFKALWSLSTEIIPLQTGFPTIIGEQDSDGIIDIPEPYIQLLDLQAATRFRNFLTRYAKPVIATEFIQDADALDILSIPINYKPSSLKVYRNGLRLKLINDYSITSENKIQLNIVPESDEDFIVEYTKL